MIWAIGDLHLDHTGQKPMDIFGGNWANHEERIFTFWKENIKEEDTVLIVGDISWALRLEDSVPDLERIHHMPGTKLLIKGNHDYWWSSLAKLNNLDLHSLHYIFNTGRVINGVGYCGTRGWSDIDSNSFDEQDEKIYKREMDRLNRSIDAMEELGKENPIHTRIAMIHYPPFSSKGEPNDFAKILSERGIDLCIYGHLHAYGHKYIVEGEFDGVRYQCVSSDYIDFQPVKLEIGGEDGEGIRD
ncbi:metallophosphoesterase [Peptoniphilus sp. KCTC 25270]|uniref:metallophosphoesterase n=1 Tax=Peptoniphilus sp. KCTC 25270 TaxID=2897414 RepID=UPI001E3059A6|nr:metallophosphoesterase [Peptoniphilus sp. KCTC 25270]MCD1147224.1 metallophosphoesterase [Peptoniphilus sp. KCTC 25270]